MSARSRRYDVVEDRKWPGYLAAIAVGALLTFACVMVDLVAAPLVWEGTTLEELGPSLDVALLVFSMIALGWTFGGLFALPVWWGLHKMGFRGPVAAAISGAALVALPFWAATNTVAWTLVGSGLGAAAGLTLWRVAYRRVDTTDHLA